MLNKILDKSKIKVVDSVTGWEEAIRLSAIPLLNENIITNEYLDAIYETHKKLGPYYVLAPGIAMPHARPEQGSNDVGLSMLVVKEGVTFNSLENDPIFIIVMLAAKDSNSHIEVISLLADMFDNEEDVAIIKSGNPEDIYKVIDKY